MERSARLQTVALTLLGAFAWLSVDLASIKDTLTSYFPRPAADAPVAPPRQVEWIGPIEPAPASHAAVVRYQGTPAPNVREDRLVPTILIAPRPLERRPMRVQIATNMLIRERRVHG